MSNNQIIDKICQEVKVANDSHAKTPWGTADEEYPIARGVTWYSTPGHGGLAVARGIAMKKLSPQARELGEAWGSSYWYEEDVAWNVAFYENPEWEPILRRQIGRSTVWTQEQMKNTIERYFPDYFKQEFIDTSTHKFNRPKIEINDILQFEHGKPELVGIVRIEGKNLIGRSSADGRLYKIGENFMNRNLIRIERDKKIIWEKKGIPNIDKSLFFLYFGREANLTAKNLNVRKMFEAKREDTAISLLKEAQDTLNHVAPFNLKPNGLAIRIGNFLKNKV